MPESWSVTLYTCKFVLCI